MDAVTLLYDADCGVCRWLVAKILAADRAGNVRVASIQSAHGQHLLAGVPEELRLKSWHLIDREGAVHSAGDGFAVLAAALPGHAVLQPAAWLFKAPLGVAYRSFAANRSFFGRYVPADAKVRAQAVIDARTTR